VYMLDAGNSSCTVFVWVGTASLVIPDRAVAIQTAKSYCQQFYAAKDTHGAPGTGHRGLKRAERTPQICMVYEGLEPPLFWANFVNWTFDQARESLHPHATLSLLTGAELLSPGCNADERQGVEASPHTKLETQPVDDPDSSTVPKPFFQLQHLQQRPLSKIVLIKIAEYVLATTRKADPATFTKVEMGEEARRRDLEPLVMSQLEEFLLDDDFALVFGMPKVSADWTSFPRWKRDQLKKAHGLF
jgi:hypothetical protein